MELDISVQQDVHLEVPMKAMEDLKKETHLCMYELGPSQNPLPQPVNIFYSCKPSVALIHSPD